MVDVVPLGGDGGPHKLAAEEPLDVDRGLALFVAIGFCIPIDTDASRR